MNTAFYLPKSLTGVDGFEPPKSKDQNLLPCRLAIPLYKSYLFSSADSNSIFGSLRSSPD